MKCIVMTYRYIIHLQISSMLYMINLSLLRWTVLLTTATYNPCWVLDPLQSTLLSIQINKHGDSIFGPFYISKTILILMNSKTCHIGWYLHICKWKCCTYFFLRPLIKIQFELHSSLHNLPFFWDIVMFWSH